MNYSGFYGDNSFTQKQAHPATLATDQSHKNDDGNAVPFGSFLNQQLPSNQPTNSLILSNGTHQVTNERPKFTLHNTILIDENIAGNMDQRVYCIDCNDEKIVAGLRTKELVVWNIRLDRQERRFRAHDEAIYCLKIFQNFIISGSKDKSIKIYDMTSYLCIRTLNNHNHYVLNLAIHDNMLVSCSTKTIPQILCWDIHDVINLTAHAFDLYRLALLQSNYNLVLNQLKLTCFYVDINENFIVAALSNFCLVYHRINKLIILLDGAELKADNKPADITSVQLDSVHLNVICGFQNGIVKIWRLKNFPNVDCIKRIHLHSKLVTCIKSDDKLLLTGSSDLINSYDFSNLIENITSSPIPIQHFDYDDNSLYTFYYDANKIVTGLKRSIQIFSRVHDYQQSISTGFMATEDS